MIAIIFQLLINGVLLGGIYALAAFGLSLIFGVSNVLNLAHGEFLMLGGLFTYIAAVFLKLNPFIALLLIVPTFWAVGAAFERGLIKHILSKPHYEQVTASILVTLGVSLAIEDVTAFLWGPEVKGVSFRLPSISFGGVMVSSLRLLGLFCIFAFTLSLHTFLKRTYTGKAMRALTQNRRGALLSGINFRKISMVSFGVGAALAAIAGVFYVVLFTITPFIGLPLTIKYLSIIVLGGLGSLFGSFFGGMIIGITEVLTGFYFGAHWSAAAAFTILVAILIVRPQGLLGRA